LFADVPTGDVLLSDLKDANGSNSKDAMASTKINALSLFINATSFVFFFLKEIL
jgi:hypothetical protein